MCVWLRWNGHAQNLDQLVYMEEAADVNNFTAVDSVLKTIGEIEVSPYKNKEVDERWQDLIMAYYYQKSTADTLFLFIDDCVAESEGDRKVALLINKGMFYRYHNMPDSTIKYMDLVINNYSSPLDYKLKAYWHQGIAYDNIGKGKKSIEILVRADSLGQESQDTLIRSRILNSIGVVANYNRSYELGLEYYIKSYSLIDTIQDKAGLAMYYLNIGDCQKSLTRYKDSETSLNKAIEIAREGGLKHILLNALGTKGLLFFIQNDLNGATEIYEEKLGVERTLGDDQLLTSSLLTLSYYHSLRKDKERAYGFFDEAISLLKNMDKDHLKNQMYAVKKEISYNFGDYKQAYKDFARYKNFKDSLNEVSRKNEVDDLLIKYETEKKEKEILSLNLDNEKKDSVIRRNWTIQGLLGSLAVTLLGLFFFVRKQFQSKTLLQEKELEIEKEKIKQLEAENKLISLSSMLNGQEEERNRLARDLHDGLGGLMASISNRYSNLVSNNNSLPEMESRKTQLMINEACEELRRISRDLVPASLYLMGLNGAVEDMMERYQSEHKLKFNLEVIGEAKKLDEKQKVLIFRMIQELLHNAIKHADAENVVVQLHYDHDQLLLLVEDDGRGFDLKRDYKGLGIRSLQSRIDFLGGTLQPYSELGKGTSIQISIPYSYDKSYIS